jgi:hypothetical protein
MISKNLSEKINSETFLKISNYLGISIETLDLETLKNIDHSWPFIDLEIYFLAATYNLKNSRISEGFLCWLIKFGHLLSPSKTRRLILSKTPYDPVLLGVFLNYINEFKINHRQWKIIKKYTQTHRKKILLLEGPKPRNPNPLFLKNNILAPNFKLETDKFLKPSKSVFINCLELKNRALFGSVANADVASYLNKNPQATAYETALATHHFKARVFEILEDIKLAM